MKQRICPVCGHLESAGTEYCTECHAKTIEYDDGTGEPETEPEEEPEVHAGKRAEHREKGSRGQAGGSKGKDMPLGKIGIVAVLVIVGLVFWNRHMNQEEDPGSDAPSGSGASSSVPESGEESSAGTMAGDEDGNAGEPAQSSGNYELIVADVTWAEAYDDCLARGGRLVRIDSEEESQAIWQQIVSEGKEYVGIWLGEVDEAANGTTRGYYEISADGYSSTGNIDIDTWIDTMEVTGVSVGYICEYDGEVSPEQENPSEPPAEGIAVEEGINTYELIVADVTWSQAYYDCMDRGGHLVRITTDAEYQAILQQIASEGKENIIFWIGGARNDDSGYYWIYDDGYFGSEILNEDAKYASCWLDGEPSFYDSAAGIDENRMSMFRLSSSGQWVWNDVPDDILSVASFYSGKIGYICEYE